MRPISGPTSLRFGAKSTANGRSALIAITVSLLLGLDSPDVARSAEAAPDILGLRRLERIWPSDADDDTTLPFIAEEPFIMQPAEGGGPPVKSVNDEMRQSMVAWLNEYAQNQVLFRGEDLAELRDSLQSSSDARFARWMEDSQSLRERLSGDAWQPTQVWLRDFMAVQAIYSHQQVLDLRTRLARLTPSRLMRVSDHFQTVHLARVRSSRVAEQFRQQRLMSASEMRGPSRTARSASFASSGNSFPATPTVNPGSRYSVIRRPTLSQRVSSFYIYRGVFGDRNGLAWWLWP